MAEIDLFRHDVAYHQDITRRVAIVLPHMLNHGTDHRSKILRALKEVGAPPFDQDFILWLERM